MCSIIRQFFDANYWSAIGSIGSMIAALLSYTLFKKSESKNRPIPKAEAKMDGGIRRILDDMALPKKQIVLIPIEVRVWNEGYVDSAIKTIHIVDSDGYPAQMFDLDLSQTFLPAPLMSGQIQDFNFYLNIGNVPSLLDHSNDMFFPRDELRNALTVKEQDLFCDLCVIIELTNHEDLIGHLPNPFFGTPKADPIYPHNKNRHLFSKISFRKIDKNDFPINE